MTTSEKLTLIGIGSSAGGLEAIRELVSTLPSDVPVSYIVVQHMSPHHKSLMAELVGRQTSLKVENVVDGIVPAANTVYITPPNADLLYRDGALRLVDPSKELAAPKPSVDRFLVSLADGYGAKSVAIILSGTGSDGAYGVQAIREAGGITIAQNTESAKYDGMPMAAVQTGCIDLILRPVEIGTHLRKILSSPRDFGDFSKNELAQSPLSDLLHILLARTRVDFREYKQSTLMRRIERRMMALGIDSIEDYAQFCRANPHAVDALYKDLLISVTRFFRDAKEFSRLRDYLPNLLSRSSALPLRVWIPGCATGEEVYSIAMMLSEAYGVPKRNLKDYFQIFATDIDKAALQTARRGEYGMAALNDIPADLAEKYLLRQSETVRVVDSLRSTILFSHHNVCQDPPFQKIDLLCCRNLLIYFGNNLQQKVMNRFHYSMTDDAVMFLGTAESVAGSEELFVQDDRHAHLYRRRKISYTSESHVYSMPRMANQVRENRESVPRADMTESTDRKMFDALMRSLGNNSLLVTEDYSIVRINGDISPYVQFDKDTRIKMHIDLLRSPLREEARSLVTIALKNGQHRGGVRHLLASGDKEEVRLDVYPIVAKDINERAAVVVFKVVPVDEIQVIESSVDLVADEAAAKRIRSLENEVATTREALQQTIEELETSNEELQSLNEEMQSTNEELQATNEELETSNEELQSTNEELITVNEELQITATELNGRTNQLTSVLESAPMPILVLDNALQIIQATKEAMTLFQLKEPLSSPHISQCATPEKFPVMAPICNEALRLGEVVEREFDTDGSRVQLNTSPFFDDQGKIQGVTMVVTDFPGLAGELDLMLNQSNFFVMNRDKDGRILRISERAAQALATTREKAEGRSLYDFLDEASAEHIRTGDAELLEGPETHTYDTVKIVPKSDGPATWLLSERFVYSAGRSDVKSIYSIATDVTDLVDAQEQMKLVSGKLALLQEEVNIGYWSVDLANDTLHWSDEVYRIHGVSAENYTPDLKSAIDFYHPEDAKKVQGHLGEVTENGGRFDISLRIVRPDGNTAHVQSTGIGLAGVDDDVRQIFGVFREMPQPQ